MINNKLIDNWCGKRLAITMCAYNKEAKIIITWKISFPKTEWIKVCCNLPYLGLPNRSLLNKKKQYNILVTKSRYVFDVHHEMDAEFNMHTHFHFTGQLQVHNPK